MRPILREPLPFPHVEVEPSAFEELKKFTIDWANRWLDIDERQMECAYVNVKHCSPKNANLRGLTYASIYLLWFFAFNDLPDGIRRAELMQDISNVLMGNRSVKETSNIALLRATSELVNELLGSYTIRQTRRLFNYFQKLTDATRLEAKSAGKILTVRDYVKLRHDTVGAHPYLELYRINLGASTRGPIAALVRRLEKLAVKGIYLVNDVFSVERDIRKGKQNLVRCLAVERKISIDAALDEVLKITCGIFEELAMISERVLTEVTDDETQRYVTFLGSIQEGNRVTTLELYERYFGNG